MDSDLSTIVYGKVNVQEAICVNVEGGWPQIGEIPAVNATSDTPELGYILRSIFFFNVLNRPVTPLKPKEITGTARHALQKKISLPGFSRKSLFFLYVYVWTPFRPKIQL